MTTVPAFLSVHVEPDAYQLGRSGPATWDGYDAIHDALHTLRTALADTHDMSATFTWMFRMDPQIQATTPSAAHAVTAFGDRVDRLGRLGDRFGIHVHPLVWSDERNLWVHDFVDPVVARRCVTASVDAFRQTFGEPPRVHSYGAGLFADEVIDALEDLDVWIDMTADRHYAARASAPQSQQASTGIDESPIVGTRVDCNRVPSLPYRPSHENARRDDRRHGRQIVVVPLSAVPRQPDRPAWRRAARRLRYGEGTPLMTLYTSKTWASPRHFWNLVDRHISAMRRPYVALAFRSDAPGSTAAANARALLEHLPTHPVAHRLQFVDPVVGVPGLLPDRARRGLRWVGS